MKKVSTVKVDKRILKLLDRFQAEILLKYGVKLDKKEVVEKAVEWALTKKEFIREVLLRKQGKDKMLDLLEKPIDWGIEDSSINIDKHLYGE